MFIRATISFLDRDGDKITARVKVGASFLDAAIDNDVELEGISLCIPYKECQLNHWVKSKSLLYHTCYIHVVVFQHELFTPIVFVLYIN